jgi:hypothetical protein
VCSTYAEIPRTTAAEMARMELLMETIAKGLIIMNDRDSSKKEDHTAPLLLSKATASLLSTMMTW